MVGVSNFMFFSSRLDYGLILLAALKNFSAGGERRYFNLKKISRENNLPYPYLERVAQKLARGGLISAKKGKNGGYALAKHPSKISVLDAMRALENSPVTYCAYLRNKKAACRVGECCPTKAGLAKLEKRINAVLKKTTLEQL